jgi:hypothetical protein
MNMNELPISISNYIIISDFLSQTTDKRLYIKMFRDYIAYLPAYKVSEICIKAHAQLSEMDFECVLDSLWKCVAIM